MRRTLNQRRGSETFEFEHDGVRYIGTISRFGDGSVGELFLNAKKHGTGADTNARDAAIACSLALQFGCPLETLHGALSKNPNGESSGPIGRLIDLLMGKET